jgi:hypothetical protein
LTVTERNVHRGGIFPDTPCIQNRDIDVSGAVISEGLSFLDVGKNFVMENISRIKTSTARHDLLSYVPYTFTLFKFKQ